MAKIVGLTLRALEFVFTVILLGLVGALEHQSSDNPESVHYSMFTAAFSMLSLFYLIPATVSEGWAGHPMILIVIDTLNVIFFFCAAVTLAARTRGHSCGDHVRIPFSALAVSVECYMLYVYTLTIGHYRAGSTTTRLPRDRQTDATRPKPQPPSSGSDGPATWSVSCCQLSVGDQPPTSVLAQWSSVLECPRCKGVPPQLYIDSTTFQGHSHAPYLYN